MIEHDEPLPGPVRDEVEVTVEPRVAVTVQVVKYKRHQMAINYGRLRSLTAREIISALIRDGFSFDRGSGSHQIYYRSDGRRVAPQRAITNHENIFWTQIDPISQ